jgi:hypothetical protein
LKVQFATANWFLPFASTVKTYFHLTRHAEKFIFNARALVRSAGWAAWLGRRPDKIVVAPRQWYCSSEFTEKDLVPEHWVRL